MTTTQRIYKHRATEPLPDVDRAPAAGAHRASKAVDIVIASVLCVALVVLLLILRAQT